MQARHRKRHRLMWTILGPLTLIALIYALVQRIKMPVMEEVPGQTERKISP